MSALRPSTSSLRQGSGPATEPPGFDLLVEPWLPVLTADGEQMELGLAEVLLGAHELRDLCCESPLVTVALCRLLLAVLHRTLGPADGREWERLWRARRFDRGPLEQYLGSWGNRFDLFDARRPFYQTSGLPERLAGSVRRLCAEQAAGHQATLFDHHRDDDKTVASPAQAARWLVAHHSYCLSGCCNDGRTLRGVPAGPLAHLAVFLLSGDNLFETLLLNMTPYCPAQHVPLPCLREDRPAWEADEPPAEQAGPAGYVDLLTWQTRSVLLVPEGAGRSAGPSTGSGPIGVRRAVIMPGRQYPVSRLACEPMAMYLGDARRPGQWRPLRVTVGRAASVERSWWQDLATILKPSTPRRRRPVHVEGLARRCAAGALPAGMTLQVSVCGLSGEKARIDLWRRERCHLPLPYLHDDHLLADLELALQMAAGTHRILSAHVWQLAQRLSFGSPPEAAGGAFGKAASGAVAQSFWRRLELPVRRLIERLPGPVGARTATLGWWSGVCRQAAWQVWREALDGAGARGRAWRWQAVLAGQMAGQLRREVLGPWEETAREAV